MTMTIRDLLSPKGSRPALSFEFFPPKDASGEESLWRSFDRLMELSPRAVSVTYGAGGSNQERTLAVVDRMAPLVPTIGHLTCVNSSRSQIAEIIRRFEVSGVSGILALRGDAPKGLDPSQVSADFSTAIELIEMAKSISNLDIGVAAFPEGHPESPSLEHDARILHLKQASGASFAITQLFFELDAYWQLVDMAKEAGVTMSITPGLMPIANAKQVLRMASMSGAHIPTELVAQLDAANEVDARRIGMDFTIELGQKLLEGGAPGLHIFTLNQSAAATELAKGVGLA